MFKTGNVPRITIAGSISGIFNSKYKVSAVKAGTTIAAANTVKYFPIE